MRATDFHIDCIGDR